MTEQREFQAQHGHPGEDCRVGEYDGKATTCVRSWELEAHAKQERRADPGRDTGLCPACRRYVPIVTHVCPA